MARNVRHGLADSPVQMAYAKPACRVAYIRVDFRQQPLARDGIFVGYPGMAPASSVKFEIVELGNFPGASKPIESDGALAD